MSLPLSPPEIRASIVEASESLFINGVMSHSGHANLSARVDDSSMLLTIDGQVRSLGVDRLALVDFDGSVREGDLDPTNAEIVAMHGEVYRLRHDVGGIIHVHSPNLLAFALAHRPLPCRYEALLRFGQAEDVPVVPWAPRGTERSVGGIIDVLRSNPGTNAVILANHGVLVLGANPRQAASLATVLEEAAEAEIAAASLGGARDFPEGALRDVRSAMARVRS